MNTHNNKPSKNRGWHLLSPRPMYLSETSRPRSCIYINNSHTPQIQPIHFHSQEVSAFTVTVQDETFLLLNVYNQPKTLLGFEAMEHLLRQLNHSTLRLPTIMVTDANLHRSIWNPIEYQTHDAAADTLVKLMLRWNMYLRSPKEMPTYKAKAGMRSVVTINLVWGNH